MGHQIRQHGGRLRRQLQLLGAQIRPARQAIQGEVAAGEAPDRRQGGPPGAGAAQNGADAGDQLVGVEWLVEIVVGDPTR
jgi:hypothetical protein